MSDLNDLRHKIDGQFQKSFGRTPLDERVVDILTQATSLGRFIDLNHLRDEAGDLLCSALQLCTECGWNPEDLAASTLAKITSRQDIYNRLGRKLRVALLGGAFDPIHRGHIEAAQAVLQFGGVDEVWLMPCYEHLAGKAMAAPEHRLEMCRVAVRSLRAIGIFDYELRHRFRGETYHLIKSLLAEEVAKLRCDFHLVIGQDNAEGFSTWTNGEALERMIPFIVVPRPGCASPKLNAWYLRAPHRFLADAPSREAVSSTEVRRRLHDRDATVEDLLPEGVWQYIRTQGLYQPEPATVPSALPARKTAIFVSTFDPPSIGYRTAVERLLETGFNQVVFCPAFSFGMAPQQEHAATTHRAALADLSVRGLPSVVVDLSELERRHSPGFGRIETRYEQDAEVWHVVDVDQVSGGRAGRSIIQTCWEGGPERWQRCRFVVLHAPADPPAPADLPPQCQLLPIEQYVASAALRNRIYAGDTIHGWLMPEVANYVKRHRLFRSFVPGQSTRLQILQPRLLIEFDARNPNAAAIAERYQKYAGEPPNVILVIGGDGTMLHAIRRHWRLRVPFLGLNAGHLGFLANERLPDDLDKLNFVAYSLPMLRVASRTLDGRTTDSLAFSDAWLERDGGQAAWLRLDIDGQTRVRKIVGDGMLLATAAGSSAYARALGASPLPLNTPVLTLAGSNVFQPRFWKPMTLAEDSEVSLISLDRSGKRPVRGFVDGQPLGVIESLSLARSAVANVELAFVGEFDPTAKLLRSLFPPTEEA